MPGVPGQPPRGGQPAPDREVPSRLHFVQSRQVIARQPAKGSVHVARSIRGHMNTHPLKLCSPNCFELPYPVFDPASQAEGFETQSRKRDPAGLNAVP